MTRFPHDQFAKDFLESLLSPYRNNALDLLGNLKVILETREKIEPEEQELIMQLSPLYLEKLQAAK